MELAVKVLLGGGGGFGNGVGGDFVGAIVFISVRIY